MRSYFQGADARLSARVLNEHGNKTLIALHGMRDHSGSFALLAEALPDYRLILPDLRGHGMSDHPGVYSMAHFSADLLALYQHYEIGQAALLGHSLGGHIVGRFAGLFPNRVSRLILVDGFGPPRAKNNRATGSQARHQADQVAALIALPRSPRRMLDLDEAVLRYQKGNPKLTEGVTRRLTLEGIKPHGEGGVVWRWDPRAQQVWATFSHEESESLLGNITASTCVITGSEGLDYWLRMHPELAGEHAYYQAELQRRLGLFNSPIKNVVLEGAGHMVHYDVPSVFGESVAAFLGDQP